MGAMLKAGLPIERVLRTAASEGRADSVTLALRRVLTRVSQGGALSEAFRAESPLFPALFVEMVEVGEVAGGLDRVLTYLADHYEWRGRIRRRAIIGLIWPGIEFFFACMVIALVMKLALGSTPLAVLFLAAPFIIAVVGYVGYSMAGKVYGREAVSRGIMRIPLVGKALKAMALAKFSFALGMSLQAALPIRDCLRKAGSACDNQAIGSEVERMIPAVERGETLFDSFSSSKLIPDDLLAAIEVGEVSGELTELVGRMSEYYQEEAQTTLEGLVTGVVWTIRIAVLLFAAIFILWFYLVYYGTAFDVLRELDGR